MTTNMDTVANPCDAVIYGKYPCMDRDGKVVHPKGMESFVIKLSHCPEKPIIIPAQLAVTWSDDLIEVLENNKMATNDFLLVTAPKAGKCLFSYIIATAMQFSLHILRYFQQAFLHKYPKY